MFRRIRCWLRNGDSVKINRRWKVKVRFEGGVVRGWRNVLELKLCKETVYEILK